MTASETGQQQLSRELGLWDIVMLGIGGIVGAGIYAIIGEAAAFGGSMLWLSFLIASVVALCTAATYAELVSRHPDAGGSFEYVKQAFGPRIGNIASFFMLITGVVAAAAIAISFSDYLGRLLDVPAIITTIAVILLMAGVNAAGAAEASWFNTVATLATLAGLAAVVAVAADDIGSVDLLDWSQTGFVSLGMGSALIFFSFIGFEDLVKLAEETKEPETTMPRGLLISGAAVVVIYLIVAVAAVSALGVDDLASAPGPLAEIMRSQAGPIWATGIVIVALFATSKTILSNLIGASRLLFDVGRDNGYDWLKTLVRVNPTTNTPLRAIAAVTVVAIGFAAIGNLRIVAAISNIFILLVFLTVNVALIRLRLAFPEDPPFKIPFNVGSIPVTAIVAIVGVLALLVFNVIAIAQGQA